MTKQEIMNRVLAHVTPEARGWTYVIVEHRTLIRPATDTEAAITDEYVTFHELHFGENKTFGGITEEGTRIVGNDLEDMRGSLEMMLERLQLERVNPNAHSISQEEFDYLCNDKQP